MQDVIFVHGMFQNAKSWDGWVSVFKEKGFNCVVPSWPLHEGEPADLRANPPEKLGDLSLQTVLTHIEGITSGLNNPVMIGHSVGGLITQIMINRGKVAAGIALNSVAPNNIIDFDFASLKNIATIVNPLKGNEPAPMDAKTFHAAFANTLSESESNAAFERTATHDSRNVLRDCMGSLARLDLDKPHNPLLLIGGDADQIVPADLTEKNYKAYEDDNGATELKIFKDRSHFICNEPGWKEVASFCTNWIAAQPSLAAMHQAA